MKVLTTAIFGKAAVGTALYTAVGGRIYKGRAPDETAYPYIVYQLVSDVADWTFTENLEDVLIQFSIFSSASSSSEVEDLYVYLKALYDNCTLVLAGSTLLWMHRTHATLMTEEHTTPTGTANVWHYAVDYSVYIETA